MKRRRPLLAAALVPALSIWPGSAGAQTVARVYRVGVLFPDPAEADSESWHTFVDELARRGYVEGRTLHFEKRFAKVYNPAQLDQLAVELARLAPDLIYAELGTQSALAAKKATATIPIVFYSSADPVGLGLVASLARPGGNLTGNAILSYIIEPKTLQLLVEAVGKRKRIAYICQAGTRRLVWFPKFAAAMTAAAEALGANLQFVDYETDDQIDDIVTRLVTEGVDAAYLSGPLRDRGRSAQRRVAEIFIAHHLPTAGDPSSEDADDGLLLRYRAAGEALARTAAEYVDRILKGAKPADLPVQQPTRFELTLNLKTAKALGLTIPPALLLRADRIIE